MKSLTLKRNVTVPYSRVTLVLVKIALASDDWSAKSDLVPQELMGVKIPAAVSSINYYYYPPSN